MSDIWQTCKLRTVADIRVSNVDKKFSTAETPVRLCNYLDVYLNNYISKSIEFMNASASKAEIDRFSLFAGDVVITKDSETPDDIGISAVITESIDRLVCGYHLAMIRPRNEKVNAIYLSKQLCSSPIVKYFAVNANGSTRYGLSIGAIENLEMPLAPKPEQDKIAEILLTVDMAIEQTEALIAKQQRIKAGMMQDLLTRGIDEQGNLRSEETHEFKDSPLGRIPVEWNVVPLLSFANSSQSSFVNGPFGSDLLASELQSEGVPVIYVRDIKPGSYQRVSTVNVSETKADQLHACNVIYGDVLAAKVGDPPCDAAPYFYRERAVVTQDVIRIRPSDDVNSSFLCYLLNSHIGRRVVNEIIITLTSRM